MKIGSCSSSHSYCYSARSDSIGLVMAARRAGIQLESSAISISTLTAKPSVRTSRANHAERESGRTGETAGALANHAGDGFHAAS
jgi:hypothetical protein